MPDVPPPEGLKNLHEIRRAHIHRMPAKLHTVLLIENPIEIRPTHP